MRSRPLLFLVLILLALCGCRTAQPKALGRDGTRVVTAVDSGGRPISALEAGSSLEMTAEGLAPRTLYEFEAVLDGRQISFARATSDPRGRIPPFILWYQSGVVGCATRAADRLRPIQFRTFEEAEEALRGRSLRVTAREAKESGDRPNAISFDLPLAPRRAPMVYPSNSGGCLVNALENESEDLFVSGRNFEPNETLTVSVVSNQRAWYTGDLVLDVTGASAAAAPKRITADANGRFTVRAWDAAAQRRGVYDIVVQRHGDRAVDFTRIDRNDIISYGSDSAVILYLIYPPGGSLQDLAGRPIIGSPYFEFADSFADTNDNVWAAVDPTYVPPLHPGGIYAGYHVVAHRSVMGWDPMMGGSDAIADISMNGVEVMPVKAGCINATDTIIWPSPVPVGDYDVVVDFGDMPANMPGTWLGDGQYESSIDFLDGASQIGFRVAKDPYELDPAQAIGQASYSVDNFFASLGGATNVDLRAVVRYPATMAGTETQVAAGTHPLFVMLHGNHWYCRVCTDNSLWYDRYKTAVQTGNYTTFNMLCTYTHATCPDRTKNHEGYMRLLEILASHGVIAVSIDAYDLNGQPSQFIIERADLMLKHLEMWSHLNNAANFPAYPDPFGGLFTGKVDMTRISLAGHSRGGEASVVAYLRNAMLMPPFSINSVSSLAPVDFTAPVLPAVPYFVILPAADGDVSSLSGARIYDRAGSGIADATTKSEIYVYGANHNFFNTVWAIDFDDYADDQPGWPVRADFIPAADQQKIGEAYLAAFHRIHLKGETVYEDMLRGGLVFPSTAGRKIYHTRHETTHSKLDAGTGPGAPSAGAVEALINNPSPHQTATVRLGWPSNTAVYTYTVPMAQRDTTGFEVLSFRVAQTPSASNPMSGNQNFFIELAGGGNTRGVFAGQFDAIPKPYPRPDLTHTVLTTVRLPLHSFIINNSGVTLNNIDTIRFRFTSPGTGEIYVDDVEFSR